MNDKHTASTLPLSVQRLLLAGILVLAALLRFSALDAESLWIDEAGTYNCAQQATWGGFTGYLATHERTPPLYYLLLRPWIAAGDTLWWARALSALIGLVAVYVTYFATARSLSSDVGLVAALFVALSPYELYYSQELRSYILQFLGTTLATGALAWLVSSPPVHGGAGGGVDGEARGRLDGGARGGHSPTALLAFVLGTVISIGSGYVSLLVTIVHAGLVAWLMATGRLPVRPMLLCAACTAVLALPFLAWLPAHVSMANNFSPPPPEYQTFFLVFCHFVGGVDLLAPVGLTTAAAAMAMLLFLWGAGDVDATSKPATWRFSRNPAVLVWVLSAVFPAVMLYTISLFRPIMLNGERYMIIVLGPFWVVAALGLVQLRPWMRTGCLALLGVLIGWTLFNYYSYDQKLRWNDVAAHVEAHRNAGDCMITVPLYNAEMMRFYLEDRVNVLHLPPNDEAAVQELQRKTSSARTVWIASIVIQPTILDSALEQMGFKNAETLRFDGQNKELRLTRFAR